MLKLGMYDTPNDTNDDSFSFTVLYEKKVTDRDEVVSKLKKQFGEQLVSLGNQSFEEWRIKEFGFLRLLGQLEQGSLSIDKIFSSMNSNEIEVYMQIRMQEVLGQKKQGDIVEFTIMDKSLIKSWVTSRPLSKHNYTIMGAKVYATLGDDGLKYLLKQSTEVHLKNWPPVLRKLRAMGIYNTIKFLFERTSFGKFFES